MSATALREAARLMRERAAAVDTSPVTLPNGEPYSWEEGMHFLLQDPDAQHVASWHPHVALAVADLLDDVADAHPIAHDSHEFALAIAHAFLGESA